MPVRKKCRALDAGQRPAWAFGMVVIFLGIDLALGGGFATSTVPILALTLAIAGAVVVAVHGLALVWFLRPS